MLIDYSELRAFDIAARDGHIGSIVDLYFDDRNWTTRYLVVDTGGWLGGRKVLLDRRHVTEALEDEESLKVDLTKQRVEDSPEVSTDMPVSQQIEMELAQHYELNPYWYPTAGATPSINLQPMRATPADIRPVPVASGSPPPEQPVEGHDPHLRSCEALRRYKVHSPQDSFGHVVDYLVDTDDWAIRYVVVDTGHWLPGRKVLVATSWIVSVDWDDGSIRTELTRDQIEGSPEYDETEGVSRRYETKLFDYYGRPVYWS